MSAEQKVTSKEILQHSAVSIDLAAEYLGVTPQFVRKAILDKVFPFGVAVMNGTERYTYHISPYRLVAYYLGADIIKNHTGDLNLLAEKLKSIAESEAY